MIALDYILLATILIWAVFGFRKGFLQTLGSLIGIIIAVIIASRFYPILSAYFGSTNVSDLLAFITIFGISIKLIGIIFWVFGKIFEVVTVLPFISSFDSLLGAVLGLVQGIFMSGIVLYFLSKHPINEWVIDQMMNSPISAVLLKITYIFVPLFPEAIKTIKSFL